MRSGLKAAWLVPALAFALCCATAGGNNVARAQTSDDDDDGAAAPAGASASIARRLSSPSSDVRRLAAEDLARAAAKEHLRLVAGYRLQERDSTVRLALDWALYRMGKNETLFLVVRDLDSLRHDQAAGYLTQLESPDPLYVFLDRANDKTRARLIEVLGQIGDAETLKRIIPYQSSFDPKVSKAARTASREITQRLASPRPVPPTRPRQVGNGAETPPL
ncbi:MAG TPA: hypothetical protein VF507_05790 [Pyrinomonadaceae bacterium]